MPECRLLGTTPFEVVLVYYYYIPRLQAYQIVYTFLKYGFKNPIGLENFIKLNGNQNKETLKKAYQESHFVILPSKSEGWPKAIAEGMFWGSVPLATSISCVPFMLDYGNRGILLTAQLKQDLNQIQALLQNEEDYLKMRKQSSVWSRYYTLDIFENEIQRLVSVL
jgi:glycosyltransferase involved in cell wall biosynthesis